MKVFITLLFLCIFSICAFAQYPEYNIHTFNSENGLPNGNINSILQDSHGFMWFGTSNGLLKYDGYSFTSFKNSQNSTSLSNNIVTNLYETSDSLLFIGTREGLHYYNKNTLEINRIENKNSLIQKFSVRNIAQNKANELYVSGITQNRILKYTYHPQNLKFTTEEIMLGSSISSLIIDNNNRMWYANTKEIFCKTNKGIEPISISLSGGFIHELYAYKQNSILVATSKGMYMWDEKSHKIIEVPFKFKRVKNKELTINKIYIDFQGKIYVATDNEGLLIFDGTGNQIAHYKHISNDNSSISNNSIYSVFVDNMENIWMGVLGEGIQVLYKNKKCYTNYYCKQTNQTNSLSSNIIKTVIKDSKGNIWAATDGEGLCYIDKLTGNSKTYNFSKVASNKLMCLKINYNTIYVGTYNGGLAFMNLDGNEPQKIPLFVLEKEAKIIYDIEFYSPTKILIASLDAGLLLYDMNSKKTTVLQSFNFENRKIQINQYISSIQKDLHGNYWIASLGEGIYVLNNKLEFIDYYSSWENKNIIQNGVVSSLALDSIGRIWAGTMAGISVIDRKNHIITHVTEQQNLASSNVLDITCDKHYAWVSNLAGLSKINCKTFSIENFSAIDGIISSKLSYTSTTVLPKNKLFLTGDNGFIEICVDSIKKRTPHLFFNVSNIYVNSKPIVLKKTIKLAYNENNIRILFPAFNYAFSHRIVYKCKVYGHIKSEYNLGNKPDIFFANLAPGTYNVQLLAYFEDRINEAEYITFSIIIAPPFWKTWWFILIIITTILLIGYYSFQQRLLRRKKQAFLLEQKVFERTQKILTQKEELVTQADTLKKINDELIRTNSEQTKLFEILSQKSIYSYNESPLPKSHDEELIEKTIAYIHEHIADVSLNVEQLSEHANYSKIQFYRKIKILTELNPIDVIKTIRLQKAEEMLKTGKYSISEICFSVGFSDPRYFSKCFKEFFKKSPTDYLKGE